ncbi:Uncharacterised protein [Vibrio cholerae]|nr:Uncharacterised protein [Vibrio cholerae]CSC69057.1 Uncharacterised protein [Vibrio cholerae]
MFINQFGFRADMIMLNRFEDLILLKSRNRESFGNRRCWTPHESTIARNDFPATISETSGQGLRIFWRHREKVI